MPTYELTMQCGATDVAPVSMPILIRVPALASDSASRLRSTRRPRRRLRREVRMAGLTLMSVVPVGMLLMTLGSLRPDRPAVAGVAPRADASGVALKRVSLSVEKKVAAPVGGSDAFAAEAPAPATAACQATGEAVFAGYLLPVGGAEETDNGR